MKGGHINDSDMINVLSGLADEETGRTVKLHIESCDQCRNDFYKFSKSLAPDPSSMVPGPRVRKAILTHLEQRRLMPERKRSKKTIWVAMAASISVIIPFLAIYLFILKTPTVPSFKLSAITGTVLINGKTKPLGSQLSATSLIQSDSTSDALLDDSKGLLVTVGNNTTLRISHDNSFRDFNLERGSVTLQSTDASPYRVISGGYIIRPTGTRFTVSNIKNIITVGVTDGSVSVMNQKNNSDLSLAANYRWDSDKGGISQLNPVKIDRKADTNTPGTAHTPDKNSSDKTTHTSNPERMKTASKESDNDVTKKGQKEERRERREINDEKKDAQQERKGRTSDDRGRMKRGQ